MSRPIYEASYVLGCTPGRSPLCTIALAKQKRGQDIGQSRCFVFPSALWCSSNCRDSGSTAAVRRNTSSANRRRYSPSTYFIVTGHRYYVPLPIKFPVNTSAAARTCLIAQRKASAGNARVCREAKNNSAINQSINQSKTLILVDKPHQDYCRSLNSIGPFFLATIFARNWSRGESP